MLRTEGRGIGSIVSASAIVHDANAIGMIEVVAAAAAAGADTVDQAWYDMTTLDQLCDRVYCACSCLQPSSRWRSGNNRQRDRWAAEAAVDGRMRYRGGPEEQEKWQG
jgi:hypothetical protein